MKQLDIFQNEKTQDIWDSIESCIISFQEGASDEKSSSINWLESFKEKLQKGELKIPRRHVASNEIKQNE